MDAEQGRAVTDTNDWRRALANRADVKPFLAMDVLRRAGELRAKGREVLSLSVGQPAAPAPLVAREAAVDAILHGAIGYTDAGGRPDLRARIARYLHHTYAVDVDPLRVFVTNGSSAGFVLAFTALFEPGAQVVLASPGYPAYRNILKACSLQVRELAVDASTRWVLTAAALDAAWTVQPFAGVLIASPGNPTGTMTSPDELERICEWCAEHGVRLISDEIYHALDYAAQTGMQQASVTQFDDDAIVINSFSKYFCMTGWRIGWMVLPADRVRDFERLAQSLYICAPEASQIAANAAFDGTGELERTKAAYIANRQMMLDSLPLAGFGEIAPVDGAFYAYANVGGLTDDSMTWCNELLDATGVAITPGLDFDLDRGRQTVRLSFAGSHETIREACERLVDYRSEGRAG